MRRAEKNYDLTQARRKFAGKLTEPGLKTYESRYAPSAEVLVSSLVHEASRRPHF